MQNTQFMTIKQHYFLLTQVSKKMWVLWKVHVYCSETSLQNMYNWLYIELSMASQFIEQNQLSKINCIPSA